MTTNNPEPETRPPPRPSAPPAPGGGFSLDVERRSISDAIKEWFISFVRVTPARSRRSWA